MLIFGLIVRGENHGLTGGLETNWLMSETLVPSQFSTGFRHFGNGIPLYAVNKLFDLWRHKCACRWEQIGILEPQLFPDKA